MIAEILWISKMKHLKRNCSYYDYNTELLSLNNTVALNFIHTCMNPLVHCTWRMPQCLSLQSQYQHHLWIQWERRQSPQQQNLQHEGKNYQLVSLKKKIKKKGTADNWQPYVAGKKKKRIATRMGFEPTRAEHNGLAVHRLNHSATSSLAGLNGLDLLYMLH